MNCPHDGAELRDHQEFMPKAFPAFHCFECGCCFEEDGETVRENTPVCEQAQAPKASRAASPPAAQAAAEPEPVAEPTKARPSRSRK